MAKVIITYSLKEAVLKKFKNESVKIFELMKSLEENPKKGKALSVIGDVVLKELKHGGFRFYFITDGHILKFGSDDELASLLIKFISMSDKKNQKEAIGKIKNVLKSLGFDYF